MKEMRILTAGNWGSEYVRDSWKIPLQKYYSSVTVNVVPFLAELDCGSELCQRYIQSLVRNDHFDFFYFYTDGLQLEFPDEFFNSIRAVGLPIIVFHADDEPEVWYALNQRFDHRYDVIASHSRRGWERRRNQGWGDRSVYVPWGYNPQSFYKIPGVEKKYDVVFIGKHKQAGVTALKDEDGKFRQDILVKVLNICQSHGYSFQVFGLGWDKHPVLKNVYGGLLSHEKMVEVYNRSRIVFNPGYSSDENNSGFQTKLRHYEVPGCGAFQLVNHNPELLEQFKASKEIVFYQDEYQLKELLVYYLQHDQERERIALDGYERARTEHTTIQRLDYLFKTAHQLFPSRPYLAPGPMPRRIARVYIGNCPGESNKTGTDPAETGTNSDIMVFQAQDLAQAVAMVQQQMMDFDYIHLIPGDFYNLSIETDYESVRPLLATIKNPVVLSIRSSVQFFQPDANFVQVNWHNFSGFVLSPDLDPTGFEHYMKEKIIRFLLPLEFSRQNYLFLCNYLFTPGLLLEFYHRFHTNGMAGQGPLPDPLAGMPVIHSCRVVNEILVKQPAPDPHSDRRYRYARLFSRLKLLNKRVVVYGARGNPIPVLVELLEKNGVELIGFIDRDLAGSMVFGYPVYARSELEGLRPDVIMISAENSGPEIYRGLNDWYCRAAVIPLYSTRDSIWNMGY